jgi:hypothetical protein
MRTAEFVVEGRIQVDSTWVGEGNFAGYVVRVDGDELARGGRRDALHISAYQRETVRFKWACSTPSDPVEAMITVVDTRGREHVRWTMLPQPDGTRELVVLFP